MGSLYPGYQLIYPIIYLGYQLMYPIYPNMETNLQGNIGYCVSNFLMGSLYLGYQLIYPYILIWKLIASSVAQLETDWVLLSKCPSVQNLTKN